MSFLSLTNTFLLIVRWDEWVPASRLLKMTETNIALQKSLQHTNVLSAHGATSAKINPKNPGVKDTVSTRAGARKDGGTRGTKRGCEDVIFSFVFLGREGLIA
jgi:mortality factor 4-like protein 1